MDNFNLLIYIILLICWFIGQCVSLIKDVDLSEYSDLFIF